MRSVIRFSDRGKRRVENVVVGAVLLSAIALVGCDIPDGGRREARRNQTPDPITTTVAAAVTEAPVTSVTPVEPAVPRVVTYEEADSAFRDRRYAEASDLFSSYVESKPENPWGFYMLGLSAWKSGAHERAEEAFGKAIGLDRTHVKSYLNLSRVLLESGRPLEALERLDTALALDSTSNVVHRLRGLALADLGHLEAAADEYRRAIVLDEQDVWAMNNLGLLYLRQGWYEEALFPLARAIELDGTVTTFLNNLGMALEHTGRFAQAAEVYGRAVAADATHAKARANFARLDGRENDPFVEPADFGLLAADFERQVVGWKGWEDVVAGLREP